MAAQQILANEYKCMSNKSSHTGKTDSGASVGTMLLNSHTESGRQETSAVKGRDDHGFQPPWISRQTVKEGKLKMLSDLQGFKNIILETSPVVQSLRLWAPDRCLGLDPWSWN